MSAADHADDLIDYEEEDEQTIQQETAAAQQADALNADDEDKKDKKGSYVGIHSTGFRDFLLKPELLRSIVDCGFEHPSEGKFSHHFNNKNVYLYQVNYSSTRMYSSIYFGYGCPLSSQVWYG